jgi:hypothetical protein
MTTPINAAATSDRDLTEAWNLDDHAPLADTELNSVTGGIGIQREPTQHSAKVSVGRRRIMSKTTNDSTRPICLTSADRGQCRWSCS